MADTLTSGRVLMRAGRVVAFRVVRATIPKKKNRVAVTYAENGKRYRGWFWIHKYVRDADDALELVRRRWRGRLVLDKN